MSGAVAGTSEWENLRFNEKYTSTTLNELDKISLSDDFYAVGDMLQKLTDILERLRLNK